MLLKKDEASKNALLSQLGKIDEHLGKRGNRFLTGDTLCCFDCELMPRLQHVRVAGSFFSDNFHGTNFKKVISFCHIQQPIVLSGKYFMDFDIPTNLTNLWCYMYHMYHLDAFTQVSNKLRMRIK